MRLPHVPLYVRVMLGVALGVACGLIFGTGDIAFGATTEHLSQLGLLVIRMLKMLAVPLVLFAILDAIARTEVSARMGFRLIVICLVNVAVAFTIGLVLMNTIHPGDEWQGRIAEITGHGGLEQLKQAPAGTTLSPLDNLAKWIPESIVQPFSENNVISVVLLAILLGAALRKTLHTPATAEAAGAVAKVVEGGFHLLSQMLMWVVELVPFAVFGTVSFVVGKSGLDAFSALWGFLFTILLGFALHAGGYYTLMAWLVGRKSPRVYLGKGANAILTGLSTNSSLATVPITLACLDKMGVSKESARMSACIGTNLNNDGITLYEAMAALFLAQGLGYDLSIGAQLTIVAASMMAGIGIAGIPEAGLIVLPLVLHAVGLPEPVVAALIPVIFVVDWILARCRTVVNVMSDMLVAILLERWRGHDPVESEPRGDSVNRLLLIILVIGAVIGGGVYYVLRTRAPGRNYDAAKAEIERWEERANKMRTCLLGTTPASPIAAEALAIRELTNNPPEFKTCTPSISELSRGDAPDTGIKEVEDEWKGLSKAIASLASSFSRVLIAGGNKQQAINELGDALDTLDVANSNLRQAAQMDPEATGTAKPSLAKAELIMIGTSKRAKLSAWLRPSAGGMVALVEGANRPQQQLVLVPGQPPKRTAFQPGVRPSVTNVKWGMKAVKGKLEIGTLTITGELEMRVDASISDPPIADSQALFALGELTNGAIAYVVEPTGKTPVVAIGRTGLGGKAEAVLPDNPWFDGGSPEEADLYSFAVSPPDRGMLTWSHRGKLRGIIARPGTPIASPPSKVSLGPGDAGQSCLTAKYGWIASGDQLVTFDGATASRIEMPDHEMIGCDASSVLLRQSGHRYAVCEMTVPTQGVGSGAPPPPSPSCRTVDLAAGADAVPGLSNGKVIAVASRQRVLAVWREKADVTYFVMPSTFKPRLVQATERVLDVLGETEEGLAVVRATL